METSVRSGSSGFCSTEAPETEIEEKYLQSQKSSWSGNEKYSSPLSLIDENDG
jgi:hypothetical protein